MAARFIKTGDTSTPRQERIERRQEDVKVVPPRCPRPASSVEADHRPELVGLVDVRERRIGHRHAERVANRLPTITGLPLEESLARYRGAHGFVVAFVRELRSRGVGPIRCETL